MQKVTLRGVSFRVLQNTLSCCPLAVRAQRSCHKPDAAADSARERVCHGAPWDALRGKVRRYRRCDGLSFRAAPLPWAALLPPLLPRASSTSSTAMTNQPDTFDAWEAWIWWESKDKEASRTPSDVTTSRPSDPGTANTSPMTDPRTNPFESLVFPGPPTITGPPTSGGCDKKFSANSSRDYFSTSNLQNDMTVPQSPPHQSSHKNARRPRASDADRARAKKRSAPSANEKKYRSKLTAKMTELKYTIPTVRAAMRKQFGEQGEEQPGLKPAPNARKITILDEAIEYIRHLEAQNGAFCRELICLRGAQNGGASRGSTTLGDVRPYAQRSYSA